ncbi:arylesterase [Pseudodesulfovibrio senegalensis]|jgi:acyl-CoA thioesterase-1|uniref:Arylesterase n=1 Tax=Pseudodesulfovibrio senegalensis TaxID=1721087 RepID=A0A6N6N6D3_9BACT|nr:arylesterase [Pseudodesulfovibrio senegalensis]KAB1443586.1 arylesterase [Pseudodesulfovibrio senegalensis]
MSATTESLAVFGDSLSEGYGLSSRHALPAVLQQLLAEQGIVVNAVNFGVSGDTSADGLARIDKVLGFVAANPPSAVILEFGANDFYIEEPVNIVERNLDTMLSAFAKTKTPVLLVGIRAVAEIPNDYRKEFNPIFQRLAKRHSVPLYPDILAPYLGNSMLTLMDGLHPNEDGVAAIARDMLPMVEKLVHNLNRIPS